MDATMEAAVGVTVITSPSEGDEARAGLMNWSNIDGGPVFETPLPAVFVACQSYVTSGATWMTGTMGTLVWMGPREGVKLKAGIFATDMARSRSEAPGS